METKYTNLGASMPHYYRARVYDVMAGESRVIDIAECDSPMCELHTSENMGKFLPNHPDTNYCMRRAK